MRYRRSAAVAAFVVSALALAGCASSADPGDGSDAPEDPTELTLVLTPSVEADVLSTNGEELASLLSEKIGIPVSFFPVDDYAATVTAFETGQAQIGMLAPALVVNAIDRAGAVPILTVSRFGGSTYVTQWYTNDPATYCLDDVVTDDEGFTFCNGTDAAGGQGPVGEEALKLIAPDTPIAFVDETSTSGYYFPVIQLTDLGVIATPEDLTDAFFAGGHPEAVSAVARGEAVVGTSFNDARAEVVDEFPTIGSDVTVFAYSPNIPNDGIAVSGDLSDELQAKIKAAFLEIADDEGTLAILDELYNVDALTDPDPAAIDSLRAVLAAFPE